jgi:hypothetical protein
LIQRRRDAMDGPDKSAAPTADHPIPNFSVHRIRPKVGVELAIIPPL